MRRGARTFRQTGREIWRPPTGRRSDPGAPLPPVSRSFHTREPYLLDSTDVRFERGPGKSITGTNQSAVDGFEGGRFPHSPGRPRGRSAHHLSGGEPNYFERDVDPVGSRTRRV